MDYITPILTFLAGSGITTYIINRRLARHELQRSIARLYDCLHHNPLPDNFTQLVSSVCVELDAIGRTADSDRIRSIVKTWAPGPVDTSQLKQVLHDLL